MTTGIGGDSPVTGIDAAAYRIPTDEPESDGTLEWDSTTIVVVTAYAADRMGLGYTYTHASAAAVVTTLLADAVTGRDALDVAGAWSTMVAAVRNVGRPGIAGMALSAVDCALWDLKARLLDIPLVTALDAVHTEAPVYGSGGFTSYDDATLSHQLSGWVEEGITRVKMKVGRDPAADEHRLDLARKAVGPDVELYVDANGAWSRKQALAWAWRLADRGVTWCEEPVSSDDLEGLRLLRDRGPGGLDIAAGEYGFDEPYFQRMVGAGAVDCVQADVTRCGGFTGFRRVAALCDAHSIDLSAHCAPQLSAHATCAAWHRRPLEYFHDHVRIESMLFDGSLEVDAGGTLHPRRDAAGNGLLFKASDAEPFRVG